MDDPPQRREFELALMDIRRCLVDPPMEDRADALRRAAREVDRFSESLTHDPERTGVLIDTVRAARDSPGPGSNVADRTQSRSIVFGALDLLVESGTISELQALDRIDEWKERNETRG